MPTQFAVEKKKATRKAPPAPAAPIEAAPPEPPPVEEAPAPESVEDEVRRDAPPEAVAFATMLDARATSAPPLWHAPVVPLPAHAFPPMDPATNEPAPDRWWERPFGPTWAAVGSSVPAGTATIPAQAPPIRVAPAPATPAPLPAPAPRWVSGRDLAVAGVVAVVGLVLAAQVGPQIGTIAGGLLASPTPVYSLPPVYTDPAPTPATPPEAAPAEDPLPAAPVATSVGAAPPQPGTLGGHQAALPRPTATIPVWPTATVVPPTLPVIPPPAAPRPPARIIAAPHPPTVPPEPATQPPLPVPTLVPPTATWPPPSEQSGGPTEPGGPTPNPAQQMVVG